MTQAAGRSSDCGSIGGKNPETHLGAKSSRDAAHRFSALSSALVSRARRDRLFDRTAAFGPILEGADIVHLAIAHILEQLGRQRGAAARGAIQDHGLVPCE